MIEELNNKYNEFKEALDILPVNTKYNRKRKIEYIDDALNEDNELIELVRKQIDKRISFLDKLKVNDDIEKLKKEKEKCNIVNEWNVYNTAYEKMHLDYYLYQLHRYYKDDLDGLNECINRIIESFKKVEINLTPLDFTFGNDAKEYMTKILGNSTKEEIKECFENIYWKNSDIVKILELNIKSIYLKYEKKITKYYLARHDEYLKSHTDNELFDMRVKLSNNIKMLEATDPYINFQKFIDHTYSVKDFSDDEISKKKSVYFTDDNYSLDNLLKLSSSLEEYNILLKYSYLLKDMRERLEKKDEYKNVFGNALKEITKDESKLVKMVSKHDAKPRLFMKKKNDDKWIFEYKSIIDNLTEKYNDLDNLRFNELVFNKLSKDSSVLDILNFIASHYLYFVNRTKELEDGSDIAEINNRYTELKNLVYNKNDYMLLSNLALLDERQIKQIIADKYNLENISLSLDSLTPDNIEKTIGDINMFINYEYFKETGLNINDINLYMEYSKIKEKE